MTHAQLIEEDALYRSTDALIRDAEAVGDETTADALAFALKHRYLGLGIEEEPQGFPYVVKQVNGVVEKEVVKEVQVFPKAGDSVLIMRTDGTFYESTYGVSPDGDVVINAGPTDVTPGESETIVDAGATPPSTPQ